MPTPRVDRVPSRASRSARAESLRARLFVRHAGFELPEAELVPVRSLPFGPHVGGDVGRPDRDRRARLKHPARQRHPEGPRRSCRFLLLMRSVFPRTPGSAAYGECHRPAPIAATKCLPYTLSSGVEEAAKERRDSEELEIVSAGRGRRLSPRASREPPMSATFFLHLSKTTIPSGSPGGDRQVPGVESGDAGEPRAVARREEPARGGSGFGKGRGWKRAASTTPKMAVLAADCRARESGWRWRRSREPGAFTARRISGPGRTRRSRRFPRRFA